MDPQEMDPQEMDPQEMDPQEMDPQEMDPQEMVPPKDEGGRKGRRQQALERQRCVDTILDSAN